MKTLFSAILIGLFINFNAILPEIEPLCEVPIFFNGKQYMKFSDFKKDDPESFFKYFEHNGNIFHHTSAYDSIHISFMKYLDSAKHQATMDEHFTIFRKNYKYTKYFER